MNNCSMFYLIQNLEVNKIRSWNQFMKALWIVWNNILMMNEILMLEHAA